MNFELAHELEPLASIIEKHLPTSNGVLGEGVTRRSHLWALTIDIKRNQGPALFGKTDASRPAYEIRHEVRKLQEAIAGLGQYRRQLEHLDFIMAHTKQEYERGPFSFERLEQELSLLMDLLNFSNRPKVYAGLAVTAGNKRNWKIPAVASACRTVWGQELYHSDSPEWLTFLNNYSGSRDNAYDQFVKTCAPRSAHRELPGALGRLIEDVLEFYGEKDRYGGRYSAYSALRALRDLQPDVQDSHVL